MMETNPVIIKRYAGIFAYEGIITPERNTAQHFVNRFFVAEGVGIVNQNFYRFFIVWVKPMCSPGCTAGRTAE